MTKEVEKALKILEEAQIPKDREGRQELSDDLGQIELFIWSLRKELSVETGLEDVHRCRSIYYQKVLKGILNVNCLSDHSRDQRSVYGRWMIYYQLAMDGCSRGKISEITRRDRTTIIHGIKRVADVSANPAVDPDLYEVFCRFKNKISR